MIVMTGVTGFIGEQLLWKILTELPTTRAGVIVRRKGSQTAHDRVLALLKKKIFTDVVAAAGSREALMEQRIQVIEGDLPNVPELPDELDVVVHCAGDVSFDPPIDQAFTTNVIGTQRLMERMLEASQRSGKTPHYVHISTAYTAGRRRGAIPETAHVHDIDHRVETARGLELRAVVETQSRTSERLTALREEAEVEHRQAGLLTTAADTERRRKAWVEEELVKAGTERARSLGWTDVYTFTKALAERVVAEVGAEIPVSVVRPAIVESSWKHPYPGWIEGFKMAEPLILAYGRGDLPEFPASPDSVVDIVPCDHVVNATLAVCATRPEPGKPEFYHVNSGARNPLTFSELYGHVRNYFLAHPFAGGDKGIPSLPVWKFPGAAAVEKVLSTTERRHKVGEAVLRRMPRGEVARSLAKTLDKTRTRLDFLHKYLGLYNEYAQSELHFVDDNTLRLHHCLHPDDVDAFAFDSAAYDWTTYLEEVHCPSITEPVRRMDALRRKRGNRASTMKALPPRAEGDDSPSDVVAVFDLDGTIMTTNVVEQYLWARLPELSNGRKVAEVASLIRDLPGWLRAEKRDRGGFLRAMYRRYAGADLAALEQHVDTAMAGHILERLAPEAVRRIREHRAAGHTTILITGVVRPLTRPLAPLFDVIVAADLATDEQGRCTGYLATPALVGESRAAWLTHYASLHGIDLTRSYAYADSHSDLPWLSVVGHPVAVNPEIPLMRAATSRQWTTVDWESTPQTPVWVMPNRQTRTGPTGTADLTEPRKGE
ncbi:MAG TPA: HAD-IB family hydrolase [Candidatus Avipropionibacterium avicola]|uniref:HAD-IB family hydrolase n=1 Tax=Candidatus Avipropionibacterium avicola TaxID=2840701 RepID=A0A9D1GWD1_9ACTN|nr:HAD-IB family hydrolase [Candidatus Avipropionibacterium avicola]